MLFGYRRSPSWTWT